MPNAFVREELVSIARLHVLQKSLEKWTVHTTHLAELATSMYEAFAVNATVSYTHLTLPTKRIV